MVIRRVIGADNFQPIPKGHAMRVRVTRITPFLRKIEWPSFEFANCPGRSIDRPPRSPLWTWIFLMIQSSIRNVFKRIEHVLYEARLCKKFNKLLYLSTVVIGPTSGSSSNYEDYYCHILVLSLFFTNYKNYIYNVIRICIYFFPCIEAGKNLE